MILTKISNSFRFLISPSRSSNQSGTHLPFVIIAGSIGLCILTAILCFGILNYQFLSNIHLATGAFICFCTVVFFTTVYLLMTVKNSNSINQKLVNRLNSDKEILFHQLKELNVENKELRKEKELREHLLRVVSHDIKSPIKNILGILDLAIDGDLKSERLTPILKDLFAATKYTDQQLENLLSWTEFNLYTRSNQLDTTDIKKLTDQLISEIHYLASSKKIRIISKVDSNITARVEYGSLKIAINNLLVNSIKFSETDQEISISAIQTNAFVRIEISDRGIGIPKDILDTIFLPTTRKIRLGTNNEKGTGIGLLLCKKLIEDQQGAIWARSEVGKGSTFSIELPID